MQRLSTAILGLLPLVLLAGCETPPPGLQEPFRAEWETAFTAVLPGACPAGAVGCTCTNTCDAGSCQEVADYTDKYCVDGAAPAGTKGGPCDAGTCKPGLVCTEIVVAPGQFACVDPEGDEVGSLTIGGPVTDDNFANRGDIEVYFSDALQDAIKVEVRRFTFAADDAEATENWGRLVVWAYSGDTVPPGPDIEDLDCSVAFHNDCSVRMWYNGQIQPLRDGADIRVTMPSNYVGMLNVVTEDNVSEDGYQDRGDVTIKDLRGRADVEVDSGDVRIKVASDTLEVPTCGEQANQACWDWVDPDSMEPAPWDLACGCDEFGSVRVESRPSKAANATVDLPAGIWSNANMDNAQPGLTKDSVPTCTAVAECDGFGSCEDTRYDPAFPWKRSVELNDPGDSALEGAGYNLNLLSEACQNVEYVEGPDDYKADPPKTETRGNLLVCTGCLDLKNP